MILKELRIAQLCSKNERTLCVKDGFFSLFPRCFPSDFEFQFIFLKFYTVLEQSLELRLKSNHLIVVIERL